MILTDDTEATKTELASIHTYLTPEQVVASPRLLVGDVASVTQQIIERRTSLGIDYTAMRAASPEELAPVLTAARAGHPASR